MRSNLHCQVCYSLSSRHLIYHRSSFHLVDIPTVVVISFSELDAKSFDCWYDLTDETLYAHINAISCSLVALWEYITFKRLNGGFVMVVPVIDLSFQINTTEVAIACSFYRCGCLRDLASDNRLGSFQDRPTITITTTITKTSAKNVMGLLNIIAASFSS